MGRRKKNNPLADALEKLHIRDDNVYTWRENEGNVTIITQDGRRCLYHKKGPIHPHRDYHQIYSEINMGGDAR